mmetsp:Transcript_106414/g.254053  ORF Transcript_106414/g.254053 Transcript_106414/m.254053 type:complete len:241 (+) Transcript_106414:195-917(+)
MRLSNSWGTSSSRTLCWCRCCSRCSATLRLSFALRSSSWDLWALCFLATGPLLTLLPFGPLWMAGASSKRPWAACGTCLGLLLLRSSPDFPGKAFRISLFSALCSAKCTCSSNSCTSAWRDFFSIRSSSSSWISKEFSCVFRRVSALQVASPRLLRRASMDALRSMTWICRPSSCIGTLVPSSFLKISGFTWSRQSFFSPTCQFRTSWSLANSKRSAVYRKMVRWRCFKISFCFSASADS